MAWGELGLQALARLRDGREEGKSLQIQHGTVLPSTSEPPSRKAATPCMVRGE